MGLSKAAIGATGGVLADQWKEYFYCDSLPVEVLVTKGEKRTGGRSSNTKGTDNIISQGSIIAVADGQCMIIVEQGKVVDLCAEPGEYVYDNSTEPSVLNGNLDESVLDVFKNIGKRFSFGGEPPKDQRVYYVNTKEILGSKYGTQNPVAFRVVDHKTGLDLDVDIRCSGEYSYRICNPILFYANVCGNVEVEYRRKSLDSMARDEIVFALAEALARISAKGIRYSELPAHGSEIGQVLNDVMSAQWRDRRGIEMVSFTMPNAVIAEEHMNIIRDFQQRALLKDPNMAGATLVGAQVEAMKAAANNEGGAMMGFMGMGMAAQVGGMNTQNLYTMGQANARQPGNGTADAAGTAAAIWTCECGYTNNFGNFCTECGKQKPRQAEGWVCVCGAVNKGKFCAECGKPKPVGVPQYKCDKCGWEPEDKAHPPKFCPECGDPFDNGDLPTDAR